MLPSLKEPATLYQRLSSGEFMTVAIGVLGIAGKMGKRIIALAAQDSEIKVIGGTGRGSLELEKVVALSDVAIDFSSPDALEAHLEACIRAGTGMVIGTTGHSEKGRRLIEKGAQEIPILFSPNFSLGIAVCLEMASLMRKALGGYQMRIIEIHHINKKDAPSGTALALKQVMGEGVPIESIREGEVVGEHRMIVESEEERIELTHAAHSRDAFAKGALLAAKFLKGKPPGLYSLKELFDGKK
jgi:4-hydroxy-tetrahydrodipicolinate reductase